MVCVYSSMLDYRGFDQRVVGLGFHNACVYSQVNIYVDAVINHMCGSGGGEGTHSSCGSWFSANKEDFPSVPYSYMDFNDNKCKTGSGEIENYSDPYQVISAEKRRQQQYNFIYINDPPISVIISICFIVTGCLLVGARLSSGWSAGSCP